MSHIPNISRARLADLTQGGLVRVSYKRQRQVLAEQLRSIGADVYNLHLPETHTLPLIIQPNERITGIVYGRYVHRAIRGESVSRGALVVTNTRVLLVNKKPFYINCKDIAFDKISGITYNRVGPIGHVILHTKLGDFDVRTFNQRCAQSFTRAIEALILNNQDD